MSDKKRKTRLKGTEAKKPCFDCGKIKDRFKDFKPRWAGCIKHRTERGRRYFQAGCAECEKIVGGNIRQPRCIGCDKVRPKKQADGATVETPETTTIETLAAVADTPIAALAGTVETPVAQVEAPKVEEEPAAPPLNLPAAVTEGKSAIVAAQPGAVEAPVVTVEPADLAGLPEKVETPAPVVVAAPEPETLPAPEAVVVSVPPPAPPVTKAPAPSRKVASKADLFKLFDLGSDQPQGTEEQKPPF